MIFAGVDDDLRPARLAVRFEAEGGTVFDPANYRKFLYITDAKTGEILHQESRVLHQDIPGVVQGVATEGIGADICDDEVPIGLPYAAADRGQLDDLRQRDGRVHGAARLARHDHHRLAASRAVLRGQQPGRCRLEYLAVRDVGRLRHHPAQRGQRQRHLSRRSERVPPRESRAGLHLAQNPAYPVVAGQTNFAVNVNIADSCNAFYNGSSINFYQSGGGCTNTANSTVVYHEYGHHLINVGGSGQGAYGEGMSDTVAVAITDSPLLGLGFQSNCNSPLRNADNTVQYPCSTPIHSCGRVLSGSVWDTRERLVAAGVENYRELISSWVINSILLHTGTEITPQITIDFLTLDDNDDDISNGTPHYLQIDEGFSLHNMPAPPLSLVAFQYPQGLPQFSLPGGGTTFTVAISPLAGQPNGEVSFAWRVGGGSFTLVPASPLGGNAYEVAVPATDCGNVIEFYLVAGAVGGGQATSPAEGPNQPFRMLAATGLSEVLYDNGESSVGWSVANSGGLTDGAWERGIPVGGGVRGDPAQDYEPEPNGGVLAHRKPLRQLRRRRRIHDPDHASARRERSQQRGLLLALVLQHVWRLAQCGRLRGGDLDRWIDLGEPRDRRPRRPRGRWRLVSRLLPSERLRGAERQPASAVQRERPRVGLGGRGRDRRARDPRHRVRRCERPRPRRQRRGERCRLGDPARQLGWIGHRRP